MQNEDVVWRADTGQYHARTSGLPLLMPPMLGVAQAPAAAPSSASREDCSSWLGTAEATNLLLFLILIAILLRGA